MQAFLKSGKLSSSKAGTSTGSQKSSKEKKQKEKPVPWVEKYRPKKVDDVVEQQEVCNVLRDCLNSSDLPNLLLYGQPGTGKTSTILAAAHQLFGEFFKERVLELNASDDRGIAVIRTKVKNFAQLKASSTRPDGKPCPPFKIIILDEADAMTHAAQAALRRTMEKETRTTRFCLICNYVSRIIEPITSRCTKFRFVSLTEEKVLERLKLICTEENVKIDDNALMSIVDISGGDMRKAITTLQSSYRIKCGSDIQGKDNPITKTDILEMSGMVPEKFLTDFIQICRSNNFQKLEDFVENFMFEAYSASQFFDQLNDLIVMDDSITNDQKSIMLDKMGEVVFRLLSGGSEYLQLMNFGTTALMAFEKK
ncbi:replication factor C subunit 4 [Chironomus tepperi]|uniref:replication factor C subunit 4 n=1 Tax=Chironomus tepperi TaxID=113505 RepID=UPI00391F61CB